MIRPTPHGPALPRGAVRRKSSRPGSEDKP
jgi:hypothetical protein